MSGTTYGAGGRWKRTSEEAIELATIKAELREQGKDIATISGKIDTMSEAVTSMTVQMGHLVTKESCAEGRSALADDLKKRMDSERDVTGVGVPIKDLVKHYVKGKPSPTPTPYKAESVSRRGEPAEQPKKSGWNIPTWIGVISGVLAIIAATYGASVFINNTLERQEQTDRILIQIQRTLANTYPSGVPQKQQPAKGN